MLRYILPSSLQLSNKLLIGISKFVDFVLFVVLCVFCGGQGGDVGAKSM
jgi:hypothetical protein